ncbi:MAG TPA: replication-associated recombination protein A [Acidimicrobiales bacterium]|nr:replication-associated recombination protein A [Acidimicrobiales bacterium]
MIGSGPGGDLFAAAANERLAAQAPLAERMRPRRLDDMVGQEHLLGPGRPLRALIDSDRLSSVILWGPPGTGKTTLARLIAGATSRAFVPMSAVTAGVKDVRETVAGARQLLGEQGRGTILFLDEVHRFNRTQQDALLPAVEDGTVTLIGATTENPYFSVNAPLLSRSTLFRLEPLGPDAVAEVLQRALDAEGATAEPAALDLLVGLVDGDARAALTSLEVALAIAASRGGGSTGSRGPTGSSGSAGPSGPTTVTEADVEAARSARAVRYEEDDHYDVISAFIKSIRGSDPDAGLYWLARMLTAGEDARFVARRLVILASEDVGMADPTALLVADAAARAVEFVGLPEAQLNLAHAVVYLAGAPKSNRVTMALGAAMSDVQSQPAGQVPAHLRDAHYRGAARLGHGVGYQYPHDDPSGWVEQDYRPEHLQGRTYYRPSPHGREAGWQRWRTPPEAPSGPPEAGAPDTGPPDAGSSGSE